MDLGLRGRVAIVAATNKGLDRVVEELARERASVAICARTVPEVEQAAVDIQQFAVVAFLASECASYVNDTSLAVDGGMVRGLF